MRPCRQIKAVTSAMSVIEMLLLCCEAALLIRSLPASRDFNLQR
jgi:hypothetical protein